MCVCRCLDKVGRVHGRRGEEGLGKISSHEGKVATVEHVFRMELDENDTVVVGSALEAGNALNREGKM